ncbi:MAG: hypothetical protein MUP67_01240, partial [Acidimicrobiia bacterium]|nr:hypothetical protein [Acidimicrobiia bacterium]
MLTEIPQLEARSRQGGVESHLFPGIVALGFGAIGLVVLVRAVRRPRAPDDDDHDPDDNDPDPDHDPDNARRNALIALLIAFTGLVSLVLAFGDSTIIFGHEIPLPFKVLRHFVPGFSG